MPRKEFDEFHSFVLACFDQGHQRFHPKLRRITTDKTGYAPEHEAYLEKGDALAVTMEGWTDIETEFDIWVTPTYYRNSPLFRATLAHELVHGYAGLKYGHNAHWRRWYYRVMWHLQKAHFLGMRDLPQELYDTEKRYNRVSMVQGETLLCEAAETAEAEHSQVLESFWKRI